MAAEIDLSDMIIADVLERWPNTADVFNHYNTACVGCSVNQFCTVADAFNSYGLLAKDFMSDILAIIDGQAGSTPLDPNIESS